MGKVFSPLKTKDIKTITLIDQLPEPYKHIQFGNNSKILGHVRAADNKTTYAIYDRLTKSDAEWRTLRNTFITNTNISREPILILFHALIGRILIYSLRRRGIAQANILKLRILYSRRIRGLIYGIRKYDPLKQGDANEAILIKYNIYTIRSRIKYLKINTSLNWCEAMEIADLNGKTLLATKF